MLWPLLHSLTPMFLPCVCFVVLAERWTEFWFALQFKQPAFPINLSQQPRKSTEHTVCFNFQDKGCSRSFGFIHGQQYNEFDFKDGICKWKSCRWCRSVKGSVQSILGAISRTMWGGNRASSTTEARFLWGQMASSLAYLGEGIGRSWCRASEVISGFHFCLHSWTWQCWCRHLDGIISQLLASPWEISCGEGSPGHNGGRRWGGLAWTFLQGWVPISYLQRKAWRLP